MILFCRRDDPSIVQNVNQMTAKQIINGEGRSFARQPDFRSAIERERVMYQANEAYIGYHELPNRYLPKDSV